MMHQCAESLRVFPEVFTPTLGRAHGEEEFRRRGRREGTARSHSSRAECGCRMPVSLHYFGVRTQ